MQVVRKRGAPLGNWNALKSGKYSPRRRADGARDALPSSRGNSARRRNGPPPCRRQTTEPFATRSLHRAEHQEATLLGSSSDADSRKTSRLFPSGDYAGGPSGTYRRMDTAAMDVMTFNKTFVP